MIAWLLVLLPSSFALWCFAAFVLRRGQIARLVAAALVPAIVVAVFFYIDYWSTRTPPAEAGWDIFFPLACFVAGAFTFAVTAVWFLAERALGKRAL